MILKNLIKQVEDHTKESFNFNNRRHFCHLEENIKRLYENEIRQLNLIKQVLKSDGSENSIYDSTKYFVQKRFK